MSEVRDSARWLAGQLTENREAIRALSAPQLGNSSIEAGKVEEFDQEGTLVAVIGEQFDGTHAAVTVAGPTPPEPVAPTVQPGIFKAEVRWSGKFADDALSPMDFSHVTVHASRLEVFTPDNTTQQATITGESGDTATLTLDSGEWYFLLVAVSKAGKWSDPSDTVLAEVTAFDPELVTDALLDMDVKYDGVISDAAELGGRLDTAEGDLTAHTDRLDTAEGQLTDAFGQLETVDTRIDTAKTATLGTAAATAQTKADEALAAANAQIAQVIARGTSLVRNGDFEAGADGWQTGAFNAVETGTSRSGTKAMRIGPNPGGNVWPTSEYVPGATGRTYYLEMYVKRTGAEVKALGVGFVVQAKTAIGGVGTVTPGRVDSETISTTGWTKVSVTYKVATADAVSVRFAPWVVAGNNTYHVDDILVVDVTEAQAAIDAAAIADGKAVAAQNLAGTADSNATAALTMAGSKSRVYYSTAVATGTGAGLGDLWRQRNASNEVIAEWQWSGTPPAGSWVKQTVSGSNVSNMDIGFLTAGAAVMSQALIDKLVAGTASFQTVDVKNLFVTAGTMSQAVINKLWADVVNAYKITTTMLAVGSFDNIIPDPDFTNTNGEWGTAVAPYSFPATEGRTGGRAFKIAAGSGQNGRYSTRIPATGPATYRIAVYVKSDVAIPAGALGVYVNRKLAASGGIGGASNRIKQTNGSDGNDPIAANTWTRLTATFDVDATWYDFAIGFYKQTTFTTGTVWYSEPIATRMNAGELTVDGTVTAKAIDINEVFADVAVIAKLNARMAVFLTNDDGTGMTSTVTGQGLRVTWTDPLGDGSSVDRVKLGTFDDDSLQLSDAAGNPMTTLDNAGGIAGKDLFADNSFTYKGEELSAILDQRGRSLMAWASRGTGGMYWAGTAAQPYLHLRFKAEAGRTYAVHTSPINIDTESATADPVIYLHYTTGGADATTSSQVIAKGMAADTTSGTRRSPVTFNRMVTPPDGDVSLLISYGVVGSSRSKISVSSGQTAVLMWVEDIGPAIPETGENRDGTADGGSGGTAPAARQNYSKDYNHTGVRSYVGGNGTYTWNTAKGYQGLSPAGYGNLKSIWLFNSAQIIADIGSGSVYELWAYFYFENWYYSGGGTARIGVHGQTALPGTWAESATPQATSGSWPRGAGRWVKLPSALHAGIKSGAYRGLTLIGDSSYTTYGIATAAKLRVKYTKTG